MSINVSDIIKWVLIILLGSFLIYLLKSNRELEYNYESYKKNGDYVVAYQSKTINDLKRENRTLYDSIKKKKDVKQAVIIKYRYVYNGDTIYIPRELPPIGRDSIYTFSKNTDSIEYNLKIKSSVQPDWYRLNFSVRDNLMIVNREKDGKNEMTVSTNNGGIVDDVDVFNAKDNRNSLKNRTSIGLQAGIGYGVINKRPDVYVGVGISFRLNKLK